MTGWLALVPAAFGLDPDERVTNQTTVPPTTRPAANKAPICHCFKLSPP
jgi:hypothetical protein